MNTTRLPTVSPSAVSMIKADHAAALTLFRKIAPGTSDMVREATLRKLCTALEIHAQVEEEFFYSALRAANIDSPVLDKSAGDHEEMRANIERLRNAGTGEPQIQALNGLMNGVMHHMADEETRLLPQAQEALGEDRLSEIGAQMTRRKLEMAKSVAPQMALDSVRAAPAKSGLIAMAVLAATAWWMLARPRHQRFDAT
jgi:hemerythrin superfamily protein